MRIRADGTAPVDLGGGLFRVGVVITRAGVPIAGDILTGSRADADAIRGLTGEVVVTGQGDAAGSGDASTP